MKTFILALASLLSTGFGASATPNIIGGTGVPVGSYPWNVRITNAVPGPNGLVGQTCSGVLVASDIVLTSAHCILGAPLTSYVLRIGATDANSGVIATAAGSAVYNYNPNATGTQIKYDAGLVHLRVPVSIQPVKISSVPIRANQPAVVIGWGQTQNDPNAPVSFTLQQANITTTDLTSCQATYRSQGQSVLPDAQEFCAVSSNSTTQGTCFGDSGGPVLIQEGGGWVLYGITSGGLGTSPCMQPGMPGYFENVAYYKDMFLNNGVFSIKQYVEYRSPQLLLGH